MTIRQDLKATVKTLEGEKEYIFQALIRKDAARVFHNVLTAVVSAVADIAVAEGASQTDAVFKAIKTLDFDTVWDLAEVLLKFSFLDGTEIKDLNDTDYFTDRPEELYLAVFHAVQLNYPKVFLKLKETLSGSGLQGILQGLNRDEQKTV